MADKNAMSTSSPTSRLSASQLLRAPGFGLLTVKTGSDSAEAFLKKHFKGQSAQDWARRVPVQLESAGSKPVLVGAPSDSGGGICRGAAHGPLALRRELYARDRAWAQRDLGDVPCIPQLVHDSMLNERQLRDSGTALWGEGWRPGWPVSPLNILEESLYDLFTRPRPARPLVLGGDHSVAGPVFAALARAGLTRNLAVLHIDAHTDLLESRFGVRHCFGTWTSHAVRGLDDPSNWVQIGIRASGREREHWENAFGLRQFWARELKRADPADFAEHLVNEWKSRGCERLYVTHDIDGLDARFAPSTGTPETGGLEARWLRKVLRLVSRALPLVGSDLVEVAPVLGSPADARRTLKTAVDMIESLEW